MTNIILCGCGGRMGKAVYAAAQDDVAIVAGIDINASDLGAALPFPVYESIFDFSGKADVIVGSPHTTGCADFFENIRNRGRLAYAGEIVPHVLEIHKLVNRLKSSPSSKGSSGVGENQCGVRISLCKILDLSHISPSRRLRLQASTVLQLLCTW